MQDKNRLTVLADLVGVPQATALAPDVTCVLEAMTEEQFAAVVKLLQLARCQGAQELTVRIHNVIRPYQNAAGSAAVPTD